MKPIRPVAVAAALLLALGAAGVAHAQPAPPAPAPPPAPRTTIDADGTYAVGTEIVPGTYSSAGPIQDSACYWKRTSGESAPNWAQRTYRSGVGRPVKPPASWLQYGTPARPCDSPPRSVLAMAG